MHHRVLAIRQRFFEVAQRQEQCDMLLLQPTNRRDHGMSPATWNHMACAEGAHLAWAYAYGSLMIFAVGSFGCLA
jgi:hypothetical protein